MTSRNLLILSLLSAALYAALAAAIFHYFPSAGSEAAFGHGWPVAGQLLAGVAAGALAALLIRYSAERPPVSEVLDDYYLVRAIRDSRFTKFDRVQLSLFAGAGEELLFRGAIQPLLGIWVTSGIFVGIHGYFKFRKAGHWLFGALMFSLSMLLGLLFEHVGLISAMAAHAVYDMVMLWWAAENDDPSLTEIAEGH